MPLSYYVPWDETLTFSGSHLQKEEVGSDIPKVTYIAKIIFLLYTVYIPQVLSHRNSPNLSVISRLQSHLPQASVAPFLPFRLGQQDPLLLTCCEMAAI